MDYDGFHQMVLGAHLMPIKKGEIDQIYKYHIDTPRNTHANMMLITGAGYDEEMVKKLLQVKMEEVLEAPRSQQEFEKFFTKKIQDTMQRYTYMRLIDLAHYKAIFIGEFDSELLIKIMQTFK